MADDAGNLDVQKSINDAIAARSVMLSKQSDLIKGQVQLALELCKALKCEDVEGVAGRVQEIATSLAAAQKEADKLGTGLAGASGAAQKAATKTKGLTKETSAATKASKSFGDVAGEAFSATGAQLDALVKLTGSVASGMFSIGSSIVAIPFGIFGKITQMASDLQGQIDPVRQAMQDLKKTFGDLSTGEGAQTVNAFNDLKSSSSDLAGSGISLQHIYGYGREGLAAALKELSATAEAMGPVFGALGKTFTDNAASLLVLQKGLGLTGEDMKSFGSYALTTGQNVNDVLMETANLSLQMGAKFGISSKLIGKDMAYMTQNMGKFGSMTKTQMATATVYVRKLGLEVKDLEGVIGVFDDFESAATAASKLSQAFGMNVDAMEMMNEQDPAKRLDTLRKSFAATGKSIETMSRQEKSLLASSAGLDENMVSQALSTKNAGLSYDDIQKGAEGAAKSQLSQAEIMEKTGKNIEKLIESLNNTTGSFLDTFINGFMKGISQTKEFRALMHNVGAALRTVFKFGSDVGKMFMNLFPGMKDMTKGLTDIFEPGRFKAMIEKLKKTIGDFFTGLSKDPVKATKDFMKNLSSIFFDKFNTEKPGGKLFVDGMKKFGKAIVGIMAGLGEMLIKAAAGAITSLANFIRNPPDLSKAAGGLGGSILGPLIDSLKASLPVLGAALLDLFGALMVKFGPQIALVVTGLLAFNLAKGLAGAVAAGAKQALVEIVKDKVLKLIGHAVTAPVLPPGGGPGGGVSRFIKGFASISAKDIGMAGLKMALIAVMLTIAGAAMVGGLVLIGKIISSGGGPMTLVENVISLGVAVAAVAGMMYVATLINPGMLGPATLGLLAAAIALVPLGIFALAVTTAIGMIGPIPVGPIIAFSMAIVASIAGIGLALAAAALAGSLVNPATVGLALLGLGAIALAIPAFGLFMIAFSAIANEVGPKMDVGAILKFSLSTAAALVSMAIAFAAVVIAGYLAPYAAAGAYLLGTFGLVALAGIGVFMLVFWGLSKLFAFDPKPMVDFSFALAAVLGSLVIAFGATAAAGVLAVLGVAGALLLASAGISTLGYLGLFLFVFSELSTAISALVTPEAAAAFSSSIASVMTDMLIVFGMVALAGVASVIGMAGAALLALFGTATLGYLGVFLYVFSDLATKISSMINPAQIVIFTASIVLMATALSIAFALIALAGFAAAFGAAGAGLLLLFGSIAIKAVGIFVTEGLIPAMENIDIGKLAKATKAIAMIAVAMTAVAVSMAVVALAGVALIGGAIASFLGGGVEAGMESITSFLRMMKEKVLPELSAFAGVSVPKEVGDVILLVAELMKGMGPALEMFSKVQESSGGWFTTAAEEADATAKMMDSLGTFINTISAAAINVFKTIMTAATELVVDKTTEKKFEIVSKSIQMVASLMGSFGSMMSGLPELKPAEYETTKSQAASFKTVLNAVKDTIFGKGGMIDLLSAHIPAIVETVIKCFDLLPKGKLSNIGRKVEIIAKIIGVFSTMASTFADMMKLIPTTTTKTSSDGVFTDSATESVTQNISGLKPLLDGLVEALGPQLSTLVSKFVDIKIPGEVKDMQAQAKKIYIVMNTFADLQKIISSIPSPVAVDGVLPNPNNVVVAIQNIYAYATWMIKGVNDLGAFITDSGGVEKIAENALTVKSTMTSLEGAYKAIGTSLAQVSSISSIATGNYGEVVTAMVEDIQAVNDALANLATIDMNATIETIGGKLGLKSEILKIESKPIQMTVNLKLTMKAADIAKEIMDVTATIMQKDGIEASKGMTELFGPEK